VNELLYEIGTEEIPSGYIAPAAEAFLALMRGRLEKLGLPFNEASWYATPRRLAVSVNGLPAQRPQRVEQVFGPPKKAAYNPDGSLSKAGLGFAKSRGVDPSQVKLGATEKGEYIFVEVSSGGEAVKELLAAELPKVAMEIPFPKSMAWGDSELRFVRPIHWVLALFGGEIIKFNLGHVESGDHTRGHRFMGGKPFAVSSKADYVTRLLEGRVMASLQERKIMILDQARVVARENGATLVEDEALAHTAACLVEWPKALWGSFDKEFLALPEELLIASMKNHQKMFAVRGPDGRLTNGFIGVSNMIVEDDSVVTAGYRRVLRARLSDAKFFFDEDLKKPLDTFADRLGHVVYQKKLGTIGAKVSRFTALASYIAGKVDPERTKLVERTARLCKADLESLMVYEFPELQGVMGREYARHGGEPEDVCQGIFESYKPRYSGDQTSISSTGAIVGIADRIDTLAGCFGVGLIPTGAQDPFGLRRGALGVIQTIMDKGYRLSLSDLLTRAIAQYEGRLDSPASEIHAKLMEFFAARLKNLWTGGGTPHDLAESVLSCGMDDLAGARLRLEAMRQLKERSFFIPLATTFKRAANIAKDTPITEPDPALFEKDCERVLYAEIKGVERETAELEGANYYLEALERLAGLRSAVDRLFDEVMIMAEDERVRKNRLALLAQVRGLFIKIADFSKIEG